MEFDLTPKMPKNVFQGEGGSYYSWLSTDCPLLGEANVGGGMLILQPYGFAFPHYADSSKLGYVLQGNEGIVGMILPNSCEERVLNLKKGDVIPVPIGAISWWFNNGDSELSILFLGITPTSYIPGEFTYFILTGTQGLLNGFSPKFISKAYNMTEDDAQKLTKSQNGFLIIKLENGKDIPRPKNDDKIVWNIDAALPDVCVKNGGEVTAMTAAKFPFLGQVGLSASRVKLEANAMKSPVNGGDGGVKVVYVVKGSCNVQIVGINGKLVLDSEVKAGYLLVVPRLFVVAKIAGDEGMECFSIITTPEPVLVEFTSKASVWNALSPKILQVSLNVDPKFEEYFKSKITSSSVIIP